MNTGTHITSLKNKATRILSKANTTRSYARDIRVSFQEVLDGEALLGHAKDFAGARIVIGKDGTYLLGMEHTLIEETFNKNEQHFSLSIKKLVEGYAQGARTEFTNIGFVTFFPNGWDVIKLGIDAEERIVVWQHGKPLSHANLLINDSEENNKEILTDVIKQLDDTNFWEYTILTNSTPIEETNKRVKVLWNEVLTRYNYMEQEQLQQFSEFVGKYKPHMIIVEEMHPFLQLEKSKNHKEIEIKSEIFMKLADIARLDFRVGFYILILNSQEGETLLSAEMINNFETMTDLRKLF